MPELPDVETLRRLVSRKALRQVIGHTSVRARKLLGRTPAQAIYKALHGTCFAGTRRHGKYLFIRLRGRGWLVLHFGMTGRLYYYTGREPDRRYNAMVVDFENGRHLAYNSRRKLGLIELTDSPRQFVERKGLGADALAVGQRQFLSLLENRRGKIKGLLMNQGRIAGLGNVYTDEVLFHAGVHPETPVQAMTRADRLRLYRCLRKVLAKAIEARVDVHRLPRSYLLPNRGRDGRCPRCHTPLGRLSVSGRTTYYCPVHQRRKA